jgi:hypothetical protein
MRIDYFYKPLNEDKYLPLPKDEKGNYKYPKDLDRTYSGYRYIVRIERGTINRFMYMIAILQDPVANITPQESGYKKRDVILAVQILAVLMSLPRETVGLITERLCRDTLASGK